jgi:hypothetical protein
MDANRNNGETKYVRQVNKNSKQDDVQKNLKVLKIKID